jgi:hypothetical protein
MIIKSVLDKLENDTRYQYGLLALITLVAAALRFYKLGEWSFWLDEIYTIERALTNYSTIDQALQHLPPKSPWIQPSMMLTAFTLNGWGTNEWTARFVSTLIGIISVPAIFLLAKRIFDSGVGLIAALLLTVSPWHVFWSQNSRFYTALMLLYSLALIAFYWALERDRVGYLALSIVLLYLATSERLTALFLGPVAAFYLILLLIPGFKRPLGYRPKYLVPVLVGGGVFSALEIYSYLTSGSGLIAAALTINQGKSNHAILRLLMTTIYRIGLPLVCLGTGGSLYLLMQRQRSGLLLSSASYVPTIVLLSLAPFAWTEARYVFVSLPFWIILAAVALQQMLVHTNALGKVLTLGVLLLLVADPVSQLALYYRYQHGNRPNWRRAFALVGQRRAEGELVLATIEKVGHYYLSEDVRQVNDMEPEAIQAADTRVWFVIDEAAGYVSPDFRRWIHENSRLIDVIEVSEAGNSLSIYVYLYDPADVSASNQRIG